MLGACTPKAMIPITDLEAAKAFYGQILQLEFLEENQAFVVFAGIGANLHLEKVRPFTPHPFTTFGWSVADVPAAARHLAGRGVKFERFEGMVQDELGIWIPPGADHGVCWFKDPDGNLLSLS